MVAPVIHIGDATIQTTVEQKTYPSLHIMDHTGAVYHVAVRAQDEQLATGTETLVYEQSAINTCETVTLDAGLYRAELRGGSGGLPSKCNNPVDKTPMLGYINTSIFKLDASTTISVFRGGDGSNSGTVNQHQVTGGGASGVDSLVVLPTRTIRAIGGTGNACWGWSTLQAFPRGSITLRGYYVGGGGGVSDMANGLAGLVYNSYIAGGGGGAPNGTGGAAVINTTAGANATSTGGGNGGNATNPNGDSKTSNIGYGGRGGANVTWTCGGQTIVSYGGGGGGGVCALYNERICTAYGGTYGTETGVQCYADCADGGDGGSGSTNTSTDSYVKIYRIG